MASRHLRELLDEVQEPFVLQNYIHEKHNQLKRPSPKTQLQLRRRKPISKSLNFPNNICKHACFLSFHDSPDLRKSPLFDFCSPSKSPCRNPNALLAHVPAQTVALLLESARRIQKPKPPKNLVFGFFESIVKKISNRKRNQSNEIEERPEKAESLENLGDLRVFESGFSCSCNNSRISSIWSESNEGKSLDFETSSSGSEDSEQSPFRFVLQSSWSPGRRTPEFASPAPSPGRLRRQALKKDEDCGREGNEEEENDQNSPVSVLDPPFEDDDNERHQDDGDGEGEHDEFDLEHSFTIVQRARQKLLHKLCRFERLAELDPIELEKKIAEYLEDEDTSEYVNDDSDLSDNEKAGEEAFIREALRQSNMYNCCRIPQDMKRLVLDLMAEEEEEGAETDLNSTNTVKRVCDRLDSWKEVEMNTIDMMVELDFRRQADEWRKNVEQVKEIAVSIELAIVGFLMDELSHDLISHSS